MRFVFTMELSNHLVVRMGKATRNHVASDVYYNDVAFQELLQLIRTGSKIQRMKAAWVLSGIHAIDRGFLNSYHTLILDQLKTEKIGGVKRELLRCFEGTEPPAEIAEQLIAITMEWVTDERQEIAVRHICYRLLNPLLKSYPEIQDELGSQIDFYRSKFGRFP